MKTKLEIKEIVFDTNELTGNKEGYIVADLTFVESKSIINIIVYSDNDYNINWVKDNFSDNILDSKIHDEVSLYMLFLFMMLMIKMIKKNSIFSIKDLFMDHHWNKIILSNKRRLGMMFKQYVDTGLIPEVKFESVDSNRTRHYKKIK